MDISEMRTKVGYSNEDKTETREIRKIFQRGETMYVRYDYEIQTYSHLLGGHYWHGGESWATLSDFATWAHHTTYYQRLHVGVRNVRPTPQPASFRDD